MALRILTAADVRAALPMADCIAGMKQAYAQLSAGTADVPLRTRVSGAADGTLLVMPAHLPQSQSLAVKLVSVFPQNVAQGLPLIHALVMAIDASTGQPLALMEGGSVTAIRTGAGSGAATDILAREDASTVAIIGSGAQARTQLEAVCAVREIERVFVYSSTRTHAEQFAAEMAGTGAIPANVSVADSAADAVKQADIICAATTSSTPVFDGNDLQAGAHVNAVGSYMPTMQEVDVTTIQRSLVTVDEWAACLAEAGDLIIPLQNGDIDEAHIHAEIGAIINGDAAGRTHDAQITYFKSVGVAAQDAVAAKIALDNAIKHDLGTAVNLG